jgi:glyoxylase-like metal-dependent hydrolase (beta-lactamase superfamily II)
MAAAALHLAQYPSNDTAAYNVNSTLIVGPTEAILVDAQLRRSDAEKEAAAIAALGTHLKAIVITHPDEDHYLGAASFVQRFPGTPVYMTAAAIEEYKKTSQQFFDGMKKQMPSEAPDSLVTPMALPGTTLLVDGQSVIIRPDEQGDVLRPSNSFLWIPSLHAVIAGDIVFNRVHPWLAASSVESRKRWHQSIAHIAALHPTTVIAGHKSPGASDSPDALRAMDRYLTDFDAALAATPKAESMVATMKQQYPDWTVPTLLMYSAQVNARQASQTARGAP